MLFSLMLHLNKQIILMTGSQLNGKNVTSVWRWWWLMRGFECSITGCHQKGRKCAWFSSIIWLNQGLWDSMATVTKQKAWVFRETTCKQERSMSLSKRHKSQALNEAVIICLQPDILIKPWLQVRTKRSYRLYCAATQQWQRYGNKSLILDKICFIGWHIWQAVLTFIN